MSILRHEEVAPDMRNAYLSLARDRRRAMGEESEAAASQNGEQPPPEPEEAETGAEAAISEENFADLAEREEFVLSVTEKGFGVRSSAYDYRITGRGGQGLNNMDLSRRSDAVVAVFPVGHNDQLILVTDGGMVIRVPVHDIRIARRGSSRRRRVQGRRRRTGRLGRASARNPTRTATAATVPMPRRPTSRVRTKLEENLT